MIQSHDAVNDEHDLIRDLFAVPLGGIGAFIRFASLVRQSIKSIYLNFAAPRVMPFTVAMYRDC